MSQMLPYEEIKFEKDICLKERINTPDVSDIGCSVEVDMKYPDDIKEKTKTFLFCPESKITPTEKYKVYMKRNKTRYLHTK